MFSQKIDGVFAYTPTGCGSPMLNGPTAPNLGSAACYAIFSGNGAVSNSGVTYLTGDVGTNAGSTSGYNPLYVTGTIHPIPDGSTAQCASDVLVAYNYLNTLSADIELLYPAQFGNNLVLTPHIYILGGAVTFTDTLYLNAQGNPDAVFVIQINGALTTSTYARVNLMNGAQAKNIYWKIEGAVTLNNYTTFRGTIICNNGALGAINTGVVLDGRALTTNGALSTTAITAIATVLPGNCATVGIKESNTNLAKITLYPNPFYNSLTIKIDTEKEYNATMRIYNLLGEEVTSIQIVNQTTTIQTSTFKTGVYFYKITSGDTLIQAGKLISQQ